MKIVSMRLHGVLDYLLAAYFFLAPFLFAFTSPRAQIVSFVVGGTVLVLALLTRYPLGVLRVIPFSVHGAIEFVGAFALMAMPWIAGFQGVYPARYFFFVTGVVLFALWLFTDYKAADATPSSLTPERQHPAATR